VEDSEPRVTGSNTRLDGLLQWDSGGAHSAHSVRARARSSDPPASGSERPTAERSHSDGPLQPAVAQAEDRPTHWHNMLMVRCAVPAGL
jgi:hypothetical protein